MWINKGQKCEGLLVAEVENLCPNTFTWYWGRNLKSSSELPLPNQNDLPFAANPKPQPKAWTDRLKALVYHYRLSLDRKIYIKKSIVMVDAWVACLGANSIKRAHVKLIHPRRVHADRSVFLMNLRGTTWQALTRTPLTAVQTSSSCCCKWLNAEPNTDWR